MPDKNPFTTKVTKDTKMEFDMLSKQVIGLAIEVHREIGSGLLESIYEKCLAHELKVHGMVSSV